MSRDKQIEEMASVLMSKCDSEIDCSKKADCDLCRAEHLYEKGYRKASDVAEEIFAEIEKEIKLALDSNYKVKRDAQDDNDSLVMYVEGKIDCLRGLLGFLAELKKKYTEEGK